jgi:hypothetical protein
LVTATSLLAALLEAHYGEEAHGVVMDVLKDLDARRRDPSA